tara:strand:+ start:460 stop:600 length:141 start_codon:yes stop_codon:yes gene_type:complete
MKIYYCKVHNKYGFGKLPCSDKKGKPFCVFANTHRKADKKGQIKLF